AHPELHSFPTRRSSDLLSSATNGALNRNEVNKATTWDDGPVIEFVDAPGGVRSANAQYHNGVIQVNTDLAKFVQDAKPEDREAADRKSTRLNSSHVKIS